MAEWWSIEVSHGELSALRWKESYQESLIEAALTYGAIDWAWHELPWGVVLEVCFSEEEQWEKFRGLLAVRAALDAVPDPVNGLLIHRGRGGSSGARRPRKPKPAPAADAIALPEPEEESYLDLRESVPPALPEWATPAGIGRPGVVQGFESSSTGYQ